MRPATTASPTYVVAERIPGGGCEDRTIPPGRRQVHDPCRDRTYRVDADGLAVSDGNGSGVTIGLADGLPVDGLTCVAAAPDGSAWVGSRTGLMHVHDGVFEYYAGRRWLPDDHILSVVCSPDGTVRVRTEAGCGGIRFRTLGLSDRAVHCEALGDARHRRFGYVAGCELVRPGDLSETVHRIEDNDGLWTAMYVAAESFRYAVSGSADAASKARESMQALLRLEAVTSIPGFPARALTHRSEPQFGKPRSGEWHRSRDGEWEWKGDTSSDEMDGHFFAWGIYHDLVADAAEKEQLVRTVSRVTDHILDHGLCLVDVDGQATRWGVWAPARLNLDPAWRAERGLNSLEIMSYLATAHHITGKQRYRDAARELAEVHHYALNTVAQKILPGDFPGAEDNHSDDELAFLCLYGLLRYERDPRLRALYMGSLQRSWFIERAEACPLWNIIYGAFSGGDWDESAASHALGSIPLDLVEWRVRNSHRADLRLDPRRDRFGEPQVVHPLPWPERPLHKWNGNPYRLDGGNDRAEQSPTFWLLPYWMGRWHGLINGPEACGTPPGRR